MCVVNNYFEPACTMHRRWPLPSWEVTKKRSKQPRLTAFGAWLAQHRGDTSREAISIRLSALQTPLGGSTLAQYESGAVWAPDAAVLWGLSHIYGVTLLETVTLLRLNRKYPDAASAADLLRHASEVQPAPTLRGADATVAARLVELRAQVEKREARLRAVQDVADELIEILAAPEGAATRTRTRKGSRGHRKTS